MKTLDESLNTSSVIFNVYQTDFQNSRKTCFLSGFKYLNCQKLIIYFTRKIWKFLLQHIGVLENYTNYVWDEANHYCMT